MRGSVGSPMIVRALACGGLTITRTDHERDPRYRPAPPVEHRFQLDRPAGSFRALTSDQVAHDDERGYVAVPDLVERDLLDRVRAGIDDVERGVEQFLAARGGSACTTRPGPSPPRVPAGGAVVFSSLTPQLTGPNTTAEVRKAYILQYAPAGAEVLRGDPQAGPPAGRVACAAPERQYPVLAGGTPV